jgi:hypothetical protein
MIRNPHEHGYKPLTGWRWLVLAAVCFSCASLVPNDLSWFWYIPIGLLYFLIGVSVPVIFLFLDHLAVKREMNKPVQMNEDHPDWGR